MNLHFDSKKLVSAVVGQVDRCRAARDGGRLAEAGHPSCTVTLDRIDEEHFDAFLQMMEFQTAFMGELLDINAFDQPGVELRKPFTCALMGRKGYEKWVRQFRAYERKRARAKQFDHHDEA